VASGRGPRGMPLDGALEECLWTGPSRTGCTTAPRGGILKTVLGTIPEMASVLLEGQGLFGERMALRPEDGLWIVLHKRKEAFYGPKDVAQKTQTMAQRTRHASGALNIGAGRDARFAQVARRRAEL